MQETNRVLFLASARGSNYKFTLLKQSIMQSRQILWLSFLVTVVTIATAKSATAAKPVTNQSDYSGHQTYTKTSTPIDNNNGNGYNQVTTYDPNTGLLSGGGINEPVQSGYGSDWTETGDNPNTTTGSSSGTGTGTGTAGAGSGADATAVESDDGLGNSTAVEKGECLTSACLKTEGDPQKISLNDAAELLETTLDDSVDTLVAAQKEGSQANTIAKDPAEPRRISRNVRRNTDARRIVRNSDRCASGCVNPQRPTVEARQVDNRKIAEARKVVDRQIEESQKFIEQVNSIDPEKNIW